MTLREYLKSIADAIRSKLNLADYEKINAQQFPEAFDWVYDRGHGDGYENGRIEGYNEGFGMGKEEGYHEGKQDEYDAFWDAYQENGERTDYNQSFWFGWDDTIFKPKYDIRPVSAIQMIGYSKIKDLTGALNRAGVVLDFSQCTNMKMAFYSCSELETIPVVDTTATTDDGENGTFYYLFGNCPKLRSIEKIILKQSGSQQFTRPFNWTPELQEVRFEGVIGQNGMNFSESYKLSKASIESVINALSTTNASGLTVTFSTTAVINAFGSTSSQEWLDLIQPKREAGWSISLV